MIVLGIKAGGHDTGAAILREYRGGLNIVAIAEERLNRCKHSRQYPLMAIDYCLNAFGVKSVSDVDVVAFDVTPQRLAVLDVFIGAPVEIHWE